MRTINRDILILFFIVVAFLSYSQGQENSSGNSPLQKGAWALQFGVSSNFTLTSFQGSTFSLKYHLSEMTAIRGGITMNGSTNDGDGTITGTFSDTSTNSIPIDNTSNQIYITGVVQYLWYLNSDAPIHFYIGCGPSISYTYTDSFREDAYMYTYSYYWRTTSNTSNQKQWGLGVSGSAGVEWFPCHWASLRAEYGETFQYQWRSSFSSSSIRYTTSAYPSENTSNSGTTKSWVLSNASVNLGLSIYW